MQKRNLTLLLLCMLGSYDAIASPQFNFAVGFEHTRQTFEAHLNENQQDSDAQLDTITLAPAVHWQDWSLVISLPWQRVQGEYFINPTYPVVSATCNLISNLSNIQKLILINRGTLTPEQIQQCVSVSAQTTNQKEEVTGFNDAEIFVSYYPNLSNDNLEGSIGVGFKLDNGDDQVGLGTGTQDIFMEASWFYKASLFSLNANIGYNFVIRNSTSFPLSDYGYTWLGAQFPLFSWLQPGLEYHFQQSNSDGYDDLDYGIGYLRFSNNKQLGGRLYYTDYLDNGGYPDQELGASIHYVF